MKQLFGGYFHQGWDIEGDTDADVVAAFASKLSQDQIKATIDELDDLMRRFPDNGLAIERSLKELRSEYYYQADGLSAMDWLSRIKHLLVKVVYY